jgi:hypothetical protein
MIVIRSCLSPALCLSSLAPRCSGSPGMSGPAARSCSQSPAPHALAGLPRAKGQRAAGRLVIHSRFASAISRGVTHRHWYCRRSSQTHRERGRRRPAVPFRHRRIVDRQHRRRVVILDRACPLPLADGRLVGALKVHHKHSVRLLVVLPITCTTTLLLLSPRVKRQRPSWPPGNPPRLCPCHRPSRNSA